MPVTMMLGRTISKYRFVAPIGRGGMGTVFRAIDESLNREVAIKVLDPDLASSEVMKRFRAEAIALAKLNHPDIATIYELYRSDSDLLMVMEFVRGETLEQQLDRCGPLTLEQAAFILGRLLGALEHAHRAGIVHRDLKPANVMMTEHGGVKIMDFGIARVAGSDQGTKDGFLLGTPSYMSPEQVLGHDVDGRADLYSVGVMFYRFLTGALPFTADTAIAMAQKQVFDTPPPVYLFRKGLPEWCEGILRRALAKSPVDRFQTAEEFRVELARAMGMVTTEHVHPMEAGVSSREPDRGGRVGANAPEPHGAMPANVKTVVLRKKRFALNGLLRATALVVACVLTIFALRSAAPSMSTAAPPNPVPALIAAAASAERHAHVPRPVETASLTTNGRVTTVKPAVRTLAAHLPPLMFDARAVVDDGEGHRERKARVLLAADVLTITADNELMVLLTLPYRRIVSIHYSRGREPQWNSPSGAMPVVRVEAGTFGFLKGGRHWISLRSDARFIVLRVNETQVNPVLRALEERTGHRPERIVERDDITQAAIPHR
jgi:protein kinase-like protein